MTAPSLPSLLFSHWELAGAPDAEAAICALLYTWGAVRVGRRWPLRRTLSFLAGVGSVVVALQSGIATFDDALLSAHMAQHMLLLMVAPPLLIAGRPVVLLLRALPARRRPRLARLLSRTRPYTGPVMCLVLFYAALILTHLPPIYDATLRHPLMHEFEHALYLAAGTLLFWPLLDADPAPLHRLGGLGRLLYMLVAMLPMAVLGAYLNRHASVVYQPYAAPAKAMGISVLDDQAQAGAIMWVIGNSIMVAIGLWAVIAALLADEHRQQAREARAAAVAAPNGGTPP